MPQGEAMNRLDEIEQNLGGLTSRGASAFLSLNDIFALVAVARAATAYVKADDPPYNDGSYTARQKAEDDMRAALAPLLQETSADASPAREIPP
jgi:hypothetical protein